MALPPVTLVRQLDTHRLVPSRHLPHGDSVLVAIAEDDRHLQAIFEPDAATNDRLLAEHQRLPGIGLEELVFAVPHAGVINAAFCHPNPLGSRFNGPDRGAWYAAFALATAQAEVGFHKSVQLAEIGRFEDTVTCDDYLADFSASFHDLRPESRAARASRAGARARSFRACLDPDSYVESQALAERLLDAGSLGVVYLDRGSAPDPGSVARAAPTPRSAPSSFDNAQDDPELAEGSQARFARLSVRHAGGTCLACFRPALVTNVRREKTYRFTWEGRPKPVITLER